MTPWLRWCALVLAVLIATTVGCSSTEDEASEEAALTLETGPSLFRPGNRFAGWERESAGAPPAEGDPYLDEIQPILGKRCVVCHGCTTSPCQLKLTSYEGVRRGANATNVFDTRLFGASTGPTRMKDGVTDEDWAKKGFYSDIAGGADSTMAKLLAHGRDNVDGFDVSAALSLHRDKAERLSFECLATKEAVSSRVAKAGTGMPFGLSKIPAPEYTLLAEWLAKGAPGPSEAAKRELATPRDAKVVEAWESFFNQDAAGATHTPKSRLAMRYIFEHVFFGRIHFDDSAAGRGDFFDLVRSSTRTGDIKEIVTDVPSDSPGVGPFFYRLKKHTQLVTAKDHSVFHLTSATMKRYQALFLDAPWSVDAEPAYSSQNPFEVFQAIPGTIRSEFLIENSLNLIDAMVKGDVCNGSSATHAIRDRFFTLFLAPSSDPSAIDAKLGTPDHWHLDPTSAYPTSGTRNVRYGELFAAALATLKPNGLTVADLWRGDGLDGSVDKKNAMITVLRHGTNASAHQGPMAQLPESMWVLDYANFERLYYNLVVLYRPWSNMGHKINTWELMSFVRGHSEDLFLMFLPEPSRDPLRAQFSPGVLGSADDVMSNPYYPSGTPDLDPARPSDDFIGRVREHLGAIFPVSTLLDPKPWPAAAVETGGGAGESAEERQIERTLAALTRPRGNVDTRAEVVWLAVETGAGEPLAYTLLANRIYSSNSRLIGAALNNGLVRMPERDSLSVVRGFVGSYPQSFLRVPVRELEAAVAGLLSPSARAGVSAKYEIPRNTQRFWEFLDAAHARALREAPLDAGIIDVSAYVWPGPTTRHASIENP